VEDPQAPSLRRELTLVSATAIVISNMIGTGVFGAAGFLSQDLGRPWLVLAIWAVGGAVAMAGCLCYAELGVNLPRSGGEYIYVREAWGPMWGFLSGWISFFAGFSAPIAAGALLFADYTGSLVPALGARAADSPSWLPFIHWGRGPALALGLIAVFTAINILGVRLAAQAQNLLTGLKVSVLTLFVVLAFTEGRGHWTNFVRPVARDSSLPLAGQFAVSLIFVMYAYSGWNAAAYVVEELRAPERDLPRAMVAGTAVVVVLYLALNAAFIFALPLASLKGVMSVGAVASRALFGGRVGGLFIGIMAAAIVSSVSAMVIVGPRVYYAMARDGLFFRDAAHVHGRWGSPSRAILYQAAAAGVMVLTAGFEGLAYYIGIALLFFAVLAAAGVFRMRRRPGWKRLRALNWGYPLIPLVFVSASGWMIAYTFWARRSEALWALLTLACGVLIYRWRAHIWHG
jgi:basic amino acid/polyamine antiporter, APA family